MLHPFLLDSYLVLSSLLTLVIDLTKGIAKAETRLFKSAPSLSSLLTLAIDDDDDDDDDI